MTPVLSRAQMRAFDKEAIEGCDVPGLLLMENAGRGATDVLVRELLGGDPRGARVVVVCGAGNNGGDGFVVARHLLARGAHVEAHLVARSERVTGDARVNLDAFLGVGGRVHELPSAEPLATLEAALADAAIVVDALFGTGLDRPLEGIWADVVRAIDAAPGQRFAVDIPSGLDADTGKPLGVAIHADVTVTFAHYKLGLLTPRGAAHAGRVFVADIGVPATLLDRVGVPAARLVERADVVRALAPRPPDAHKNTAGHVGVVAGSPGKIGAALLSAHAALRAGAGLVTLATWSDAAASVEARVLEVMTARIDPGRLAESVAAVLAGKRALVVGPGLGTHDAARDVVTHVLRLAQVPVVVDADAVAMFPGAPESFAPARAAVLTPHPGELARLLSTTSEAVERDRFAAARQAAARTRAVVLLKGAHTVIAAPDGRVAINPTRCTALATAGSGDVLAGLLGALACALEPFEAAYVAAFVHGLAGESWGGDRGMLAHEIADRLPGVLGALVAETA